MLPRLTIACLVAFSSLMTYQAHAQSPRVRAACTGDAKRLCPQYTAGSSEMRSCMEARGRSLSHGCILALEADGIIARGTLQRYRGRS